MNYLETAHRNVAWFNDRFRGNELQMRPPFQRNPVWTNKQKSYLMDTILRGLPVPELYMQDLVDEHGKQEYIVVDGQQRIRACLEFIDGRFTLNREDSPEWGDLSFDELPATDKQKFYQYKFVVRTLPDLDEEQLRNIFRRLNRNVVALNEQELRHATYWGPFIKFVEQEAEENAFWGDSGIFSPAAIRRMLDIEFISELVVGVLHGVQDKKKKLEQYYQLYETEFDERDNVQFLFRKTTGEVESILPNLRSTRWRKKSDFYTLFIVLANLSREFPLSREARDAVQKKLLDFGEAVDQFVSLDVADEEILATWPPSVVRYGLAVSRAASDLSSRRTRDEVLRHELGLM